MTINEPAGNVRSDVSPYKTVSASLFGRESTYRKMHRDHTNTAIVNTDQIANKIVFVFMSI